MTYIAIWGLTAILSAIIGGALAAMKNRDYSAWAAWCFIIPPLVIGALATGSGSVFQPPWTLPLNCSIIRLTQA